MRFSGIMLEVDAMFKVIDLETTGLRNNSEIAQLAIWTLNDRLAPVSRSNYYFNIHSEMPSEAYKANKLSREKLAHLSGGNYFDDRKEDILSELLGHTLIAHNASFEKRVLAYHLDGALNGSKWICTMLRYSPTLALRDNAGHDGYRMCSLRELTDFCLRSRGVSAEEFSNMYNKACGYSSGEARFHDALFDTYCTAFAFHVLG